MRDAVLVDLELPPRMFKTFGAAPRRGAARVRPFPQVAHAPEPFQRCRRVLRPDIEALGVAVLLLVILAATTVDDEVVRVMSTKRQAGAACTW